MPSMCGGTRRCPTTHPSWSTLSDRSRSAGDTRCVEAARRTAQSADRTSGRSPVRRTPPTHTTVKPPTRASGADSTAVAEQHQIRTGNHRRRPADASAVDVQPDEQHHTIDSQPQANSACAADTSVGAQPDSQRSDQPGTTRHGGAAIHKKLRRCAPSLFVSFPGPRQRHVSSVRSHVMSGFSFPC